MVHACLDKIKRHFRLHTLFVLVIFFYHCFPGTSWIMSTYGANFKHRKLQARRAVAIQSKSPKYSLFWIAWLDGDVCWGIAPKAFTTEWTISPQKIRTFMANLSWAGAWNLVKASAEEALSKANILPTECVAYIPDYNLFRGFDNEPQNVAAFVYKCLPTLLNCDCLANTFVLASSSIKFAQNNSLPGQQQPKEWLKMRCQMLLQCKNNKQ